MLPLLTWADKQQVAERYHDGESVPQIASSFGCDPSVIYRALKQLGVESRSQSEAARLICKEVRPCRECGKGVHPNAVKELCPRCAKRFCQTCDAPLPEDWRPRECPTCKFARRYKHQPPRLCRVCGRMGARSTKRALCNVHIKWFCQKCDQPLAPNRVCHYCPTCEKEKKLALWAKTGRRCCQCGEREAKVHSSRCQHCLHEEYEVRRWALLHLDRPCRECGAPLPRGRQLNRCIRCQQKYNRQRRKERQAIGAHRCAQCHDPLALAHAVYCPGCAQMLANWRKAWHACNPIARMLGTVRTTRRWQEREPKKEAA